MRTWSSSAGVVPLQHTDTPGLGWPGARGGVVWDLSRHSPEKPDERAQLHSLTFLKRVLVSVLLNTNAFISKLLYRARSGVE